MVAQQFTTNNNSSNVNNESSAAFVAGSGVSSNGRIPKKILFIISCVSFCSNWHFGYQITYINTASSEFYEFASEIYSRVVQSNNATGGGGKLPIDVWSQLWSIIVASFYGGTLIGFLMVPLLVRHVGGVRKALFYSSFPAVVGCVVQMFVKFSTSEFLFAAILSVGRLLVGIQAGCSLCLLPPFIIEASTDEHRPFLSSFQQVFQALATLIGLLLGSDSVPSFGGWKIVLLQVFGILPTLCFIILLLLIPETPFRLLERCQNWIGSGSDTPSTTDYEWEFERSALFYYGKAVNFDTIREEAFERWNASENSQSSDKLTSHCNLKGLAIGSMAGISFAFSADDLIDSYSADFLVRSSNTGNHAANSITVLFGVLLFLSSVIGAFLIDRFGRKRLIISGLVGTAIGNLLAALGTTFGSALAVAAGFGITKMFIGFGAGAPAWFLTSELVSPCVVCTAQAISTGSLLVMTGISTLSFLSLEVWLDSAWALLLLSSIPAALITVFLALMLPETKDKSFDEIRHCLRRRFPGIALSGSSSSRQLSSLGSSAVLIPFRAHRHRRSAQMYRSQRLMTASSYASSYSSYACLGQSTASFRGIVCHNGTANGISSANYGSVRSLRNNSMRSNGSAAMGGGETSAAAAAQPVRFGIGAAPPPAKPASASLGAEKRHKRRSMNDAMLLFGDDDDPRYP